MSVIKELKLFAKDLSILIAEDQKDLNQELFDLASIFFKKVERAYDGVEALAKYKKNRFDIVLSDITMPNMNGVKLSQEIKNINNEQIIVILSAHSELEYLIQLIDIGINQFVAKPFKEEELFYRLLKVSENLVYKQHYLNTILASHNNDDDAIENSIKEFLKDENINEEFEEFGIETDLTEDFNLNSVEPSTEVKTFEDVVEHKVVDSNNFFKKLQEDDFIWESLEGQITQLIEYNKDFNEAIEIIYLNKIDQRLINEIAQILRGMYSIFTFIEVLRDLGDVLKELSEFLEDLDFNKLDNSQIEKLKLIEFIHEDISRFIETVFVYRDTLDVHYLEDSLKSSVKQLKTNVLNEVIDEEELELF